MAGWYSLTVVALLIAGYVLASQRARSVAGGNYAGMHSLPAYHGFYTASLAFLPALAVFAVGSILTSHFAAQSAISAFPQSIQSDVLKQG
ncbi:MAG: phosphate ABC transporter permease family protein, partial [Deltaproteobacteria bacterium]